MDDLADEVSRRLDQPFQDVANGPGGSVEFHGDPAAEFEQMIKKMKNEDG